LEFKWIFFDILDLFWSTEIKLILYIEFKMLGGIAHICMTLLFLLSAFVNLNDPDPTLWVLSYLFGALVSVKEALKCLHITEKGVSPAIIAPFILVCVYWGGSLYFKVHLPPIGNFEDLWSFLETEEGREIGGLVQSNLEFLNNNFR
jgi:hypothetical protein